MYLYIYLFIDLLIDWIYLYWVGQLQKKLYSTTEFIQYGWSQTLEHSPCRA